MTAIRLVPGLGLDEEAWRPTTESLPPTWQHDIDVALLPGYGERAPKHSDLRPEALAEDLLERWCPPGLPVVLAGHSASCPIVAAAARRRPDMVAGLVLVGPTTDPQARSWRALARRWLATASHEEMREVPTLLRQYSRTGLWTMARAMDAGRHIDLYAVLAESRCPVLALSGRHDHICPSQWLVEMAETSHHADGKRLWRSVTLPVGAHMVPLTHGREVAREIEEFRSLGAW